MSTKTFQSDVKFALNVEELWFGRFTNSSNTWNLTFFYDFEYDIEQLEITSDSDAVSWEWAAMAVHQGELFLGSIVFSKNDYRQAHIMNIDHFVDPLKVFHITVTETYLKESTTGIPPDLLPEAHFDHPDQLSNTVLVIGNKSVHVNNYFLAIHSPFFEKLFFGEFAEKDKNEVILENIDYDNFIEFLRVIYPERKPVTRENLDGVLCVAHYVLCQTALAECSKFLSADKSFSLPEKMCLADKYELTGLLDELLNSIPGDMALSVANAGANTFSDRLKVRMFDLLAK